MEALENVFVVSEAFLSQVVLCFFILIFSFSQIENSLLAGSIYLFICFLRMFNACS